MPDMPLKSQIEKRKIEELWNCPYCESSHIFDLFHENGFSYVECDNCSLIFLRDRIREEYISEIYDRHGYHSLPDLSYLLRTAERRLQLVGKLDPHARIFEDGAGSGAFVAVCRRNGFDAVGCDLGGDSVRVAAKYFSVELAEGSIDSLGLEEQSLDVVAGFNLLSHIYRPWVYVREVERVLNPGGVWLVRTGDRTGWRKRVGWGSWSAPEHIYHYTRRFLEEIIQDTGMKIDWIRPAFDSDYPYLIWRIVEKFPKIFKPSAKRVAGYFHYFWTICRFPREDIYILARKPQ